MLLEVGQGSEKVVSLNALRYYRQSLSFSDRFRPAIKYTRFGAPCLVEQVGGDARVRTRKRGHVRAGFFGKRHGEWW